DLVAVPRDENELVSVLDWCSGSMVAAVPFGGGSSVVGGVEPDVGDGYRAAVSVDLRNLSGVLEIDRASRAARIAAGTLGPALERLSTSPGLPMLWRRLASWRSPGWHQAIAGCSIMTRRCSREAATGR